MAMTEENIPVDGETYHFRNNGGKVELVFPSRTTHNSLIDPHDHTIPDVWIITRNNGDILFALQGDEGKGFYYCTAQELYDKHQTQWFEPLADHYRELLWFNEKDYVKDAYKIFTWKQVKEFACEDRPSISFARYMPGDWKYSSEGADGYLMVAIEGVPYWADAVGQIPFAVDTYRLKREVRSVITIGMDYGGGLPGTKDIKNEYDNYFVLRGALYAKKMYSFKVETHGLLVPTEDVKETVTNVSPSRLGQPITPEEAKEYALWKK